MAGHGALDVGLQVQEDTEPPDPRHEVGRGVLLEGLTGGTAVAGMRLWWLQEKTLFKP